MNSPSKPFDLGDLQSVFDLAAGALASSGVECLLIGGFAVNHYGYTRNTLDIDLMIASDKKDAVRRIMAQAGFTNVAAHENVTFFNRPGSPLRVDFLHVDAQTFAQLLAGASAVVLHGKLLRVPSLCDLLAMKFFALAQAPERRMEKDLPDIAYLSILNSLDLERDLHPLAQRDATEEIFQTVCKKIRTLQT